MSQKKENFTRKYLSPLWKTLDAIDLIEEYTKLMANMRNNTMRTAVLTAEEIRLRKLENEVDVKRDINQDNSVESLLNHNSISKRLNYLVVCKLLSLYIYG